MPAFSIMPIGPFAPQEGDSPKRYIQFQYNGVNLGGPDADTVNFVGYVIAVRGTSGTDENTITVTAVPPPPDASS
jgi:hypothetical protein